MIFSKFPVFHPLKHIRVVDDWDLPDGLVAAKIEKIGS